MPVFKLKGVIKDYLWGGTKLRTLFNQQSDLNPMAECWCVSAHKDGPSQIVWPQVSEKDLKLFLENHPEALGTHCSTHEFPVLVKLIDAQKDLSIQVHPDNDYAQRVEHELGKTEMWLILDAEPGASIIYGTNQSLTKAQFRAHIEQGTLLSVLKQVPVQKGDVAFIPAGTIHAIGKGIVICEIQQSSNTTYRVFDYNRKDKNGQLRELHIDKAVDVSNLDPIEHPLTAEEPLISAPDVDHQRLAHCDYFTTDQYIVHGHCSLTVDKTSFLALVVVAGTLTISQGDTRFPAQIGDSFFVTANTGSITLDGQATVIAVHI